MKHAAFALILFAAVMMVSAGSADDDATPVSALDGYESWLKVNAQPITGDDTGTLGRNVHEGTTGFRDVYVNPVGEARVSGDASGEFPVGTILVKNSFEDAGGSPGDLANVTVMVKREAGFDPENGDWEYMVLTSTMRVRSQGVINNCVAFHSIVAANDYAFLSYR